MEKSRLPRFVERAVVLARRADSRRFTFRRHAVFLCPKIKETTTFRDPVDELIEMPRIRDSLDRYFLNESREGCLNATKQSLSL